MATIKDRYVLEVDTKGSTAALGKLSATLKTVGFAAAAAAAAGFAKAIVDSTRTMQTYTNQLRLITDSQEELVELTGQLTQAAISNRAAFGDTVDLFTKLTLATADLGIEQDRVLGVTGKFQQALAISGADAGTAAGAIRQFGQAMASGTVRGDEFNSIVEALGPALAIMATESGLTVGKLRQMSQAGELTAETFFNMVESSEALGDAFNKTRPTIDQLEQGLSDAFDRVAVKIGEASGITRSYETILKSLTRTADAIGETEGALVNLDPSEIMDKVAEGSLSAAQAVEELNFKFGDLVKSQVAGGRGFVTTNTIINDQKAAIQELVVELEKRIAADEEAAKAAEAEAAAES